MKQTKDNKQPKPQRRKSLQLVAKSTIRFWFLIAAAIIAIILNQYVFKKSLDPGKCKNYNFDESINSLKVDSMLTNNNLWSTITWGNIQTECYFPGDYKQAKELFIKSAKLLTDEVYDLPVYSNSNGDNYDQTVAIIRGNSEKFFIHISGTHGAEAHAGSAIQSAVLQYLKANNVYMKQEKDDHNSVNHSVDDKENENNSDNVNPSLPTIVFVHALNPYGFAKGRRVNEDNIDLNRNFLTPEEFEKVTKRHPNFAMYVDMDPVFNPTKKMFGNPTLDSINSVLTFVQVMFAVGINVVKKAMVSGNYYKPTGISYGGKEQAKSVKNLIQLINDLQINSQAKQVLLIDVHTGLGPSGVDTLLSSDFHHRQAGKTLFQLFPTDYDSNNQPTGGIKERFNSPTAANDNDDENKNIPILTKLMESVMGKSTAGSGYDETVGILTQSFCDNMLAPHLEKGDKFCVTQEFGTESTSTVGMALVNENYAFHHGTESEKAYYKEKLVDAFYVKTKEWKYRIVRRGLTLFLEGMKFFEQIEA